jgi:hypothetical protein
MCEIGKPEEQPVTIEVPVAETVESVTVAL